MVPRACSDVSDEWSRLYRTAREEPHTVDKFTDAFVKREELRRSRSVNLTDCVKHDSGIDLAALPKAKTEIMRKFIQKLKHSRRKRKLELSRISYPELKSYAIVPFFSFKKDHKGRKLVSCAWQR
jgi:hypothetical protein